MSSFKTGSSHKKLQPGTVIIGENGLPVDTIATISGSYQILKNNTTTLAYAAGVVTVNAAVSLATVRGHKSRYTGRLILQTVDGSFYFIDKPSVDDLAKTFNIYNDEKSTSVPVSIDLSAGWIIAEAEIINRLATSAAAKIDSVEFRDMQFQLELDGDPVSIQDDDGHKLDINADGSINIGNVVNTNVDLTNVENKLDQLIGEAEAANLSLDNIEAASTDTAANTLQANVHLSAIEAALAAPLAITQPVITAGTSDGTPGGPVFVNVNNVKNQILATSDREQALSYADFGTKNQRIISITYTSPTFPSIQATKTISYTLVGSRYRRDTITWSIT